MVSYAQVPGVNDNSGGGNGSLGLGLDVICKDVVRCKSVGFVDDTEKANEWEVMERMEKSTSSKEKCTNKESIHILYILSTPNDRSKVRERERDDLYVLCTYYDHREKGMKICEVMRVLDYPDINFLILKNK